MKKNKQLAGRIDTLVRKTYSRNTHDYKNTKTTEVLMMTLTPKLHKIAIKKEHHIQLQFENLKYTSETSRKIRTI